MKIVFTLALLLLTGCASSSLHRSEAGSPEGAEQFTVNDMSSAQASDGRAELNINKLAQKPLPPEKAAETISEVGRNWFYGHGFGETLVNAGLIFAFPPFAIYALGNAALDYGGYTPLYVTNLLPPKERYIWRDAYDSVVSGPGRLAAAANGEEFRDRRTVAVNTGRLIDEVNKEVNQK